MNSLLSFEVIAEETIKWAIGTGLAEALSYLEMPPCIEINRAGFMRLFWARDEGASYRPIGVLSIKLALYHDLVNGNSMETDKKRPGNYLSMDGGSNWLSALPALLTLEEIMKRLQQELDSPDLPLPCKAFDLIIASGHVSLVVLLVGKMRLTPSQATEAYKKLEPALSVGPTEDEEQRKQNIEAFKKAFIEILEEHGFNENSLMISDKQDKSDVKIVICTQTAANLSSFYPIRSYPVRSGKTASCTILQAACASVASPDRFPPITVGSGHRKINLISAMPNYANPTKVLLPEARLIFGDEGNVATIVSIGPGRRAVPDEPGSTHNGLVADTTDIITFKCEQVHEDVSSLLQELFIYFRFDHDQIPEDVADSSSINARLTAHFQEDGTNKHLNDAVESMKAHQKGGNLRDINVVDRNEFTLKPRPSVAPNFVGREDTLEAMRQRHFAEPSSRTRMPGITVLSGLGGSGKTQIALKFADEFEAKCPDAPVYFLNASSNETLKTDFEMIIRSQGVLYRSQSCDDALAWLAAKARKWCLIIDNADDPSLDLFPYIPKSAHGNVIITTRNSTHAFLSPDDHHGVEGLPMVDAVALVLQMSRYETTAENQLLAQAIVKGLGSLPLALAHAGAYIFVHQCLSTYLDIYRASQAQFLESNQALPHDYQLSVGTTVRMSLGKLPPAARNMMVVFSHLEASSIPLQIISTSAERRFCRIPGKSEDETLNTCTIQHADILMEIFCPDGEWFEYDFNTSVQKCLEYSLLQITTRDDNRFFSMHVLVQTYLKSTSNNVEDQQQEQLIVRLLGSAITIDDDYKYQTFNRLLAPHLRTVAVEDVLEAGDHAGFGGVLHEQGSVQLSTAHWERCLESRRGSIGDQHLFTLRAMSNLASSYRHLGRYQEALGLGDKVVELQTPILGEEHPITLVEMTNLATSYCGLGRYQDAADLQKKVLEVRTRISGDEHPMTLLAMGSLASSYIHLERYQEALDLEGKVLELQTRILGDEHPRTLVTLTNLAVSYFYLGRYQEALDLQEKVLELQIRILGDEHPDTLVTMGNIALSYMNLQRYQAAVDLEKKVLKLRIQVLGDEHPATLVAMANLASYYSDLKRHQEALNLKEKVLELRTRILGDEHPQTLLAMGSLARCYSELGKYQVALDLESKVLELQKRISGDEHPATLISMLYLADYYGNLGRYQEALDLELKVLELRTRISGDEHPSTLQVMNSLTASYIGLGRYQEALDNGKKVLELRIRILGDEHPETLHAMTNLAVLYGWLGRYQEAVNLLEKVLALRKRISGEEHPETLLVMAALAFTLHQFGMQERAISLLRAVLPLLKKVLGVDHPTTLAVQKFLDRVDSLNVEGSSLM